MSGPAYPTIAPCSRPSTPLRAAFGGGLRPALTAPARGALRKSGRDEETPLSRTKKLEGQTPGSAVHFANAAAAIKCSRLGGRAGIPSRGEIAALIETGCG